MMGIVCAALSPLSAPRAFVRKKRHGSCVSLLAALPLLACGHSAVSLERPGPTLIVREPALFPETVEYDAQRDQFLLGSFRRGAIYALKSDGSAHRLVSDARLCSVLGIAVDARRTRLWVVNSDLGASVRPSASGPKALAAVAEYDLATGSALRYVDLAPLWPGPHLLNGIALDSAGNAYVTDSFSPVIYRVDPKGYSSVLLHSEQFSGDGVNLNGVVVHPGGYLLVIKKSDGQLFKVPLADPARFSRVQLAERFVGGDGLTLVSGSALVVIANETANVASNTAFALSSKDDWISAHLDAAEPLGRDYPTTATIRDHKLYVLASKLNELIRSRGEQQNALRTRATIRQIGTVSP